MSIFICSKPMWISSSFANCGITNFGVKLIRLMRISALLSMALMSSIIARAQSNGPFGIDHRLNWDETGIWKRSNQLTVAYGSILVVAGGVLYEGTESRLGQTFAKSMDSMVLGAIGSTAGKALFQRQRPSDANNPDAFFNRRTDTSFPSGEMTQISAVVTPFLLEYGKDSPAIWGLAALPAYVGIARMKSQAHWQSDILAGGALGAGVGYYAWQNHSSWTAGVLPKGLTVGYKTQF